MIALQNYRPERQGMIEHCVLLDYFSLTILILSDEIWEHINQTPAKKEKWLPKWMKYFVGNCHKTNIQSIIF